MIRLGFTVMMSERLGSACQYEYTLSLALCILAVFGIDAGYRTVL